VKVLFVVPPSEALTVTPPIGLGYMVSVLRKNGYEASILDSQRESLNEEKCLGRIKEFDPGLLGVSLLTSNYVVAKKIIKRLKESAPATKIVLGGPHASALPGATLEETQGDFLIRGEGEYPIVALMDFLEKGRGELSEIKNLCYRKNGKVEIKPITMQAGDLDAIPPPAWDLMRPAEYPPNPHQFFFKKYPIAPVITTRGCPFECTFCAAGFLAGKKLRMRSPAKVVDEIELLVNKYGVKEIHFEDDNFTLLRKHAEGVLHEIIKRDIKISWQSPNGIRLDTVDEELIRLMKESGCYRLAFGIESGSQEILDRANKKLNLDKVSGVMKAVKRAGIETQGFFILGLPGETRDTALETLKLIEKLPLDFVDVALLTYLPGSRIFNERYGTAGQEGIKWDEFNYFTAEPTAALSGEELKAFQKRALRKFYMKPKTVFRILKSIKPRQIPHVFRILEKYFV